MNYLNLTKTAACVLGLGMLALSSCNGDKEDENATVVNVEKGVASPVWTSDGNQTQEVAPMPQLINGSPGGVPADSIDYVENPAEEVAAEPVAPEEDGAE